MPSSFQVHCGHAYTRQRSFRILLLRVTHVNQQLPVGNSATRQRNACSDERTYSTGKPHPRWADPNYYDGDASDKWHTRSQKRNPGGKRRLHSPEPGLGGMGGMNGLGGDLSVGVSVKTEPMAELQQSGGPVYYRLTPSPPPGAHAHAQQVAYGNGLHQQQHHASNGHQNGHSHHGAFSPSSAFDCNDGCSPLSYSPSSPTSAPGYESGSSNGNGAANGASNGTSNGIYAYPPNNKSMSRQSSGADRLGRTLYDDDMHSHSSCDCLVNPASGHTVITLLRQLQSASAYLQQLPEHSGNVGATSKCALLRKVTELKNLLQ